MLLFRRFFAAHSVAINWMARVRRAKGRASSLSFQLLSGVSIAGTLGGVFTAWCGWNGVGGFIANAGAGIWSGRGYIIVFTPERSNPAIAACALSHGAGFTPRLTVHHRPVGLDTPASPGDCINARSVSHRRLSQFIYGVPVILEGGYYRLCDQK